MFNYAVRFMAVNEDAIFNIIKASLWSQSQNYRDLIFNDEINEELRKQSVDGLAAAVNPDGVKDKYFRAAKFAQMLKMQESVIKCIQQDNIPVVVIKGTASGIYYPEPYLRKYGDIDILVHPDNYQKALELLKNNAFIMAGQLGEDVTSFTKNGHQIELHQRPPGLGRVKEGKIIHNYLLSGLEHIETAQIAQPKTSFPMLPWKQNGLELIWHIREHLYNGLGLRQIIDWMMFVYKHLNSDDIYREYREVLEKTGLEKLALTVTRMCQIYLGLYEGIAWCKSADDSVCKELMEFILDQGNFGIKRQDDKTVKVLTRYRKPLSFISALQRKGLREWKAADRYVLLRPFAWAYLALLEARKYMSPDGRKRLSADINENKKRKELFDQLYQGEYEGRLSISHNKVQTNVTEVIGNSNSNNMNG